MKKYKLIDGDGYTRREEKGETFWLDGAEKVASGDGKKLCSSDVIHYYDHPALAVIFNIIHANIFSPRLIEIEIDEEVAHDGLKGGCKRAKFVREISVPNIMLEQKVEFAIRVSLYYYAGKKYVNWAENWLSGIDRSTDAARAAAREAAAAAAARAAEKTAEAAMAMAARAAARAAAMAMEAMAAKATAAAAAARAAAKTAEAAMAMAAMEISNFFIKTIETILARQNLF